MPADVFLLLCSSGLALITSLLFLVSEDKPPVEPPDTPESWVTFALPPARPFRGEGACALQRHDLRLGRTQPPALPSPAQERSVTVALPGSKLSMVLQYLGEGEGAWLVSVENRARTDCPAMQLSGLEEDGRPKPGSGVVHDLRWHGRAGLPKAGRSQWRKKPADA